jgi:serine/threonine protein kinase
MKYNPNERYTPYEALSHPYFDDLRDQKKYEELKRQIDMPQLFDFTEEECTYDEYQSLMPSWYK